MHWQTLRLREDVLSREHYFTLNSMKNTLFVKYKGYGLIRYISQTGS